MEKYEITDETLAILCRERNVTQILETNDEFLLDDKPTSIIDYSCRYFGSSLSGRQEGTKKMIEVTHKAPIIIEESLDLVFFPTHSPDHPNCSWINAKNIVYYRKSTNGEKTILTFNNGISLEVNVKYGSMNNQILRATRLINVLRGRKARIIKNN